MKIYLVGFMGSGKTALGRQIARGLSYAFADTDDEFEKKFHITIADFFSKYGESEFRHLEQKILHATAELDDTVIATGGGTPCFFDNMDFILSNGIAVYLQLKPGMIYNRLVNSKKQRPLVEAFHGESLREKINGLLSQREAFYLKSQVTAADPHLNKEDILRLIHQQTQNP